MSAASIVTAVLVVLTLVGSIALLDVLLSRVGPDQRGRVLLAVAACCLITASLLLAFGPRP